MLDPEKIPALVKMLGESAKKKVNEALGNDDKDEKEKPSGPSVWPPMRNEDMTYMEPDWEELDKKANAIIITYTTVSAAANILPFGLDVAAVTGTFTKMAVELAGVYQVLVSAKRARQMGWAIASSTGTVLGATYGAAYAAGRIAKFIPGAGYLVSVAIQAPLTAAVAWAAGETLKNYFKDCRMGKEPGIEAFSSSFAKTLRLRLKAVPLKKDATDTPVKAATASSSASSSGGEDSVSSAVEKLATLHELLRQGAISQEEYDKKKAELLSRI